MINDLNPENRNANLQIRFCSFCRRGGHNISRCNSESLLIFEIRCMNFITSEMRDSILQNCMRRFRDFLLNEAIHNTNIVRAFAIRKCGSTTRDNIDECIENIIQYHTIQYCINEQSQSHQDSQYNEEILLNSNLPQQTMDMSNPRQFLYRRRRNVLNSLFLIQGYLLEIFQRVNESTPTKHKFNIYTKVSEITPTNMCENIECCICYEKYEKKQFVKLDCGHEFCKDCIKNSLNHEIKEIPCCAFCRADIKNLEFRLESIKDEFNEFIIK